MILENLGLPGTALPGWAGRETLAQREFARDFWVGRKAQRSQGGKDKQSQHLLGDIPGTFISLPPS